MLDKLKELITNYVEVDGSEITEASRFSEDLGFNSYDFMCMLGDLEDEFDVEIEESEAFKLKTVSELAGYLEGLVNG
ncbi:MAG: acyl carrier protein [Ruminococcus sp.]|jgi:acyl carrier protein|nr:acyl carrier protein [Ruminococcus sp.]MBQ3935902.1 acyl carrier protein [Ruminococcus sp.]